ncbi:hypothetical protein ACFL1R_02685 [Candidatus Latescibacterota bacterium]
MKNTGRNVALRFAALRFAPCALILIIILPVSLGAEILGNPGMQVGEKNLFVGIEYTRSIQEFDIDTDGIDTSSDKILLKITTGLSDWFDIFLRCGGANLKLDYKASEKSADIVTKNFDSDFVFGFGGGTRIRLLNFIDSGTRVFFQGGGFLYKADDSIQWDKVDGTTLTKDREMKWADIFAGLGIAKRLDYVDLTFGVGFSQIWWEISDVDKISSGTSISRIPQKTRDSFEINNPVFGFIGLDFVLPYEYRLSAQAGIRNMDDAEFSVAISQGLEKD